MKHLNGFIIGIMFVLLVAVMAFGGLMAYTERMRYRALDRLMEYAKDNHIPVSKYFIKRNLDRLNLRDLKILDDWTTALDAKDYSTAMVLWPDVRTVFQKTDLNAVFGILGSLLAALTNRQA